MFSLLRKNQMQHELNNRACKLEEQEAEEKTQHTHDNNVQRSLPKTHTAPVALVTSVEMNREYRVK